ncbi:MAG: murein L,D-transpeptidase catalytic domain family protein [Bacteroidetes bacterium]|nr:murein L,D-transpeptidase catalytic domain family protein [Bacteroidota bacterium]
MVRQCITSLTKRMSRYGLLLGLICVPFTMPASSKKLVVEVKAAMGREESYRMLYDELQLDTLNLSRKAFNYAIKGFARLQSQGMLNNSNVISIVDFSLPSSKKRLFVIDMVSGTLLFNTYVSHGRGSGQAMATRFSNKPGSYMSSLGFYITGSTYMGEHGMSLRLQGIEKGINDKALKRGIVMHSADYVEEDYIQQRGYSGRSEGCPAIPAEFQEPVIETIKEGSCLFLYSPNKFYATHSRIVPRKAVG